MRVYGFNTEYLQNHATYHCEILTISFEVYGMYMTIYVLCVIVANIKNFYLN